MRRTRLALAAGLSAIAVSLGAVLARAPDTVAGTNGVPAHFAVAFIQGGEAICQGGGTIPAGTSAIRVSLSVNIGPRVDVKVFSGSRLVTDGVRGAGWGVDETVTVPVRRVTRAVAGTRICTVIGPAVEPIQVNGVRVPIGSSPSGVWLRMEYLRSASRSWLARVPAIAGDMGIAHAPSGAWVAYLVIVLMLGVCALAGRLALRELR